MGVPNGVYWTLLLTSTWFVCNMLFNTEIRKALPKGSTLLGVIDVSAMQILVSGLIGIWHGPTEREHQIAEDLSANVKKSEALIPNLASTLVVSFCHLLAIITANCSYLIVGSTLTQIFKALEIPFVLVFSARYQGEYPLRSEVCAIGFIVVSAVIGACSTGKYTSASPYAPVIALISSFAFALRNTLAKRIGATGFSALSLYSLYSAPVIIVVWAVKIITHGLDYSVHTLVSAVLFALYQLFSFQCLGRMSVTTHAVLNAVKRTLSITFTMLILHESLPHMVLSMCIGIFGTFMYARPQLRNVVRNSIVISRRVHSIDKLFSVSLFAGILYAVCASSYNQMWYYQIKYHPHVVTGNLEVVSLWTYPTAPSVENGQLPDQCVYHTCPRNITRLSIVGISHNGPYANFIRRHVLQKILHKENFVHHVQAIVLLSYVRSNPTKCAKTHGNSDTICASNLSHFDSYNPEFLDILPPSALIAENITLQVKFSTLSFDNRIFQAHVANSGDEVQGFPGIQFMPYLSEHVDRETGLPTAKGHMFGNAWWGANFKLPDANENLDLLLLSVHFSGEGARVVQENIPWFLAYNDKKGHVGARDLHTLNFLRDLGIKTYFSGCFTLLTALQKSVEKVRNKIVVVDVDSSHLPSHVKSDHRLTVLRANVPTANATSIFERSRYAFSLISLYSEAKVVITSRIHAALPASALGVPVIFVYSEHLPGGGGNRTAGVVENFHVYRPGSNWSFVLDEMTPNPGNDDLDRKRASLWHAVKRASPYYVDSAYAYGIIPLSRLGKKQTLSTHTHFHFVLNQSQLDASQFRSIESVFRNHPHAKLTVHTMQEAFLPHLFTLQEAGYVVIESSAILDPTLCICKINGECQNITRCDLNDTILFILQKYGGIYVSWGTFILRPIRFDHENGISLVSGRPSVVIFTTRHLCRTTPNVTQSVPGRVDSLMECDIPTLNSTDFASINTKDLQTACISVSSAVGGSQAQLSDVVSESAYTVHLDSSSVTLSEMIGRTCLEFLNRLCILCHPGTAEEFFHEGRDMQQIQKSHHSKKNRYPLMYSAVKNATTMETGVKILSFGSSTGEEVFSLAETYFPGSDTTIYGTDTDAQSLEKAQIDAKSLNVSTRLIFFKSTDNSIELHGPYNIIFANSVLCLHPPPKDETARQLTKMFPFEEFERILSLLDSTLKIGGVLGIFNSNYDFLETSLSIRYESLGKICRNHEVPRVDRSQLQTIDVSKIQVDCVFRKLRSET